MSAIVKVAFHGDDLDTVKNERGVWVSIRRVCESLGIGHGAQTIKLRGKAWATVSFIATVAEDGKEREQAFIHVDALPMWLATIETSRVAPRVAAKLEVYQVEAARVLRDHFVGSPVDGKPSEQIVNLVLRMRAHTAARRGTFSEEFKREFLRLRLITWDGTGSEPKPLAFAYGRTWRIVLGDDVYEELKARNPEPRDGSSHSQWLRDEAYKLAKESDLVVACAIARRCSTWSQYEHEMRAIFQRAPLQLALVRSDRRPMLTDGGE